MSILQADPTVVHAAPDDAALPAVAVRAALVALASALGTNDSRAPRPTEVGDGLRALHRVHDALWTGQPYRGVRADITSDLIDAYWLAVRADREPAEAWTAEEVAGFAALPEGGW